MTSASNSETPINQKRANRSRRRHAPNAPQKVETARELPGSTSSSAEVTPGAASPGPAGSTLNAATPAQTQGEPAATVTAVEWDRDDPTVERFNSQEKWYRHHANFHRVSYLTLKTVEILAAALVPVVVALNGAAWINAALGAAVVALEGVQGVFKFRDSWMSFRSARESLMREQSLYLARADVYSKTNDNVGHQLFAERIEDISSQEHKGWIAFQRVTKGA